MGWCSSTARVGMTSYENVIELNRGRVGWGQLPFWSFTGYV